MFTRITCIWVTSFILLVLFIKIYLPAAPADTYYHLAVGRQIYQEKKIPTEDNFIYAPQDKHITSTEWLSGLIFFLFVKYFGLNGLYISRIIFASITLYFLFKSIKIFTSNTYIACATIIFSGYLLAYRFNDRPEIFSFAFLSIINYTCLNYLFKNKLSKLIFVFPLIFLLWPNLHAFIVLGLLIFMFFVGIFILNKNKFKKESKYNLFFGIFFLCTAISYLQFQKFLFGFNGQGVSKLLTEMFSIPYYFEYYGFYAISAIYNVLYFIYFTFYTLLTFLYLTVKLRIFIKKSPRKFPPPTELLLIIFYGLVLASPFKFIRLIPMAVMLTLPIFVMIIRKTPLLRLKNIKQFDKSICAALLVFIFSLTFFSDQTNRIYQNLQIKISPKKVKVSSDWGTVFPAEIPPIINKYLNSKHIFASNYLNSYFIWTVPSAQVYSDVVFETSTTKTITDEIKIGEGTSNWTDLLKDYDIDTIVNKIGDGGFGALTPVYTLKDWKLVYVTIYNAVYAREDVIKSLPVDLSAIHPEFVTDFKFKIEDEKTAVDQLKKLLEFDTANDFARAQLILYYRDNDIEQAKTLATQSKELHPKIPWYSYFLASISARQKNCKEANKFGKEAIIISKNDFHVKNLVQKVTSECNKEN